MSESFTFRAGRWTQINTTVVTDESEVDENLKLLYSNISSHPKTFGRVVGLGIEKSFSSTTDGVISEKVAVLKLSTGNYCLFVHLIHFKKIPTSLAKFLNLSDITVVGVGIKQNLCDLRRDYGIQCGNAVVELGDLVAATPSKKSSPIVTSFTLLDLSQYRQLLNIKARSYEPEPESDDVRYCNLVKSTDVAFGDWGSSELSKDQICQASMEGLAIIQIAEDFGKFMNSATNTIQVFGSSDYC